MKKRWYQRIVTLLLACVLAATGIPIAAAKQTQHVLTPREAVAEMTWGVNLADLYLADVDRWNEPGASTGYYSFEAQSEVFGMGVSFWDGSFTHAAYEEPHPLTFPISFSIPAYHPGDPVQEWVGGPVHLTVLSKSPDCRVQLSLADCQVKLQNGAVQKLDWMNGAYTLGTPDWGPDGYGTYTWNLAYDHGRIPMESIRFSATVHVENQLTPEEIMQQKVDYFYQYGRHKVDREQITDLYLQKGVNVFRLPVTWTPFVNDKTFEIDRAWLDAVAQEVNYILDSGAYCILNTHNDYLQRSFVGDHWADDWMEPQYQDYVNRRFAAIWTQIANYFKDYPDHLILEPFNEPTQKIVTYPADLERQAARINGLNRKFVEIVRSTGGNNATRLLCLAVAEYDRSRWLSYLEVPEDPYLIAQLHSYDEMDNKYRPNETYQAVTDEYFRYAESFMKQTGIPVILGEVGIPIWANETQLKEKYADTEARTRYFFGKAEALGIPCLWWEDFNYSDQWNIFWLFDKHKMEWRRPQILKAIMETVGVTETQLPAKLASVQVEDGLVTVTVRGAGAATVWAAAYDSQGRMLAAEQAPAADPVVLHNAAFGPGTQVQVFLLDGSGSPLCRSVSQP